MHSPDDAQGMFDVLTYQKGAAILRMLERYLGADRFREGIRLYLSRHAYGNTETHDLWHAIEESSGEPVRRIMDQWIWQGGYPLLTASPDASGVRLDQRRFLADGGGDPESTLVGDVMSRDIATIGPDEDLSAAGEAMRDREVRRLVVVDGGAVVGVLSHGAPVQATGGEGAGRQATLGVTEGAQR